MVLGIYGASGLGAEFEYLARLIEDRTEPKWEDMVFIDDDPEKVGTTYVSRRVLSFEQAMQQYGTDGIEYILGIGEPEVKDVVFQKLLDHGCEVTSLFYPGLLIGDSMTLGKGVVFCSDSSCPPNSKIGNNVLIQGYSIMGHDVVLGDNVVISSLAFVGGDTTIGRNTYVAPGAIVRNGLTIGENAIIGMGAVVTKDVPDNAVVVGNPGKIIRYNEKGRVFSK